MTLPIVTRLKSWVSRSVSAGAVASLTTLVQSLICDDDTEASVGTIKKYEPHDYVSMDFHNSLLRSRAHEEGKESGGKR